MRRIGGIFSSIVIRNGVALLSFLLITLLGDYYARRLADNGKGTLGAGSAVGVALCIVALLFSVWANHFAFKSTQDKAIRIVSRTILIIVMVLIMLSVGFLATVRI